MDNYNSHSGLVI